MALRGNKLRQLSSNAPRYPMIMQEAFGMCSRLLCSLHSDSRPIIVPDVKGMLAGKVGAGQLQQNPAQGVQQMLGNILGKKKKPQ